MVAGPLLTRPAPPASEVAATTVPLVAKTDNCELEELQLDKSLLIELRYLKLPLLDVKLLRGAAAVAGGAVASAVPPLPTLATEENLGRLPTAAAWGGS